MKYTWGIVHIWLILLSEGKKEDLSYNIRIVDLVILDNFNISKYNFLPKVMLCVGVMHFVIAFIHTLNSGAEELSWKLTQSAFWLLACPEMLIFYNVIYSVNHVLKVGYIFLLAVNMELANGNANVSVFVVEF